MRIFISWSGERSKYIAKSLRKWLPKVIQAVQPWMSDEDIESGARWSAQVAAHLDACAFGIICVTPENQNGSWLNFEAGALSKVVSRSFVCPYLCDLDPTQLSGPLSQFQAISASEEGTKKLITSINMALEHSTVLSAQLDETFSVWWPRLQSELEYTLNLETISAPRRTNEEIIQEILINTREQLRRENSRIAYEQEISKKGDSAIEKIQTLIPAMEGMLAIRAKSSGIKNSKAMEDIIASVADGKVSSAVTDLIDMSQLTEILRKAIVNSTENDSPANAVSATDS